jgi:hypothetical protein
MMTSWMGTRYHKPSSKSATCGLATIDVMCDNAQLLALVDPDEKLDVDLSCWPHGRDVSKLVYYLSKFLLMYHGQRGIGIDSLPISLVRLIEAYQRGGLSDADMVFTANGIVALRGVGMEPNGAIRCLPKHCK